MTDKSEWQQRAAKLFCFAVFAVGAYLGIKYILPVLAPILAAFAVSAAVSGVAKRISRALGLPRGLCAVVLVSVALALIGFFVFYLCRQLVSELKRIIPMFAAGGFSVLSPIYERLKALPIISPLINDTEQYASDEVRPIISRALSVIYEHLSSFLAKAIKATPDAFMAGVVSVVSCYYMSMDFDRICGFLISLLPKSIRERLPEIKGSAALVMLKYLKAYGFLFVMTFFEILIGLFILCPSFAWLGALIVAAVDIMPVLGAGLILIPWGICKLILGDIFVGVGLLVLYVVVTVIRQIAEPRLIGESLGAPPLATVTVMYVGYRFFGVFGMLASPVLLSVAIKALKSKKISRKP